MQNKYSFRIKFEKSEPSINAETYVQSLISLSTIIREVNYQVGNGPGVTINVLAQDVGSFDVLLQIAEAVKENQTLIKDSVEILGSIVATTVGVVQLKKWMKKADESKTEISGDQVNIKDTHGDVIFQTNNITYNLFKNNQAVNDAVSDQFQAVNKDGEVDAVTIAASEGEVTFAKEDFETLAEKRIIEIEDTEVVTVPAQLTISKLVLDNADRKWEFVYQGSKIGAKVSDEAFWQKILAGDISFANGDVLVADLKIIRELDKNLGAFLNREYCVLNVRQHLPRANKVQTTIDDIGRD